jgi:hypothetical protein
MKVYSGKGIQFILSLRMNSTLLVYFETDISGLKRFENDLKAQKLFEFGSN